MQPWAHQSELATYLTTQRIAWKSRRPIAPSPTGTRTNLGAEDISRLNRAIGALQELQQRFAPNDGPSPYIARLLDFTLQLRNDLPLQVPEGAFERLRALRSWLFWLPPLMIQPDQTDLAAIVVLSYFFAISMTIEPLFPEIGAAYIGSMSVNPVEEMHHLLAERQVEQPEDASLLTAIRLMEFPYQVLLDYKSRLEYMNRNTEIYRSAPHSPYGIQDLQSAYSFEGPPSINYQHSRIGSPANLSIPTVPSSPYLDPRATTSSSQRSSQYLGQPSPMLHSQMSVTQGMFPTQQAATGGSYSTAPFGPEGDLSFGDAPYGYHESYQAYGGMGGCVPPAELLRT